jgi:hypothetical protein
MAEMMPASESSYAKEGTEAHELAERCLNEKCNAHDVSDNFEMTSAVQGYLDYIFQALKFGAVKDMYVEKRFNLESIHEDIGGTADCVLVTRKNLEVIDYKHGQGVYVSPENNPQLMIYGLGAYMELTAIERKTIKDITLTVIQPRMRADEMIRSWCIKPEKLVAWEQEV